MSLYAYAAGSAFAWPQPRRLPRSKSTYSLRSTKSTSSLRSTKSKSSLKSAKSFATFRKRATFKYRRRPTIIQNNQLPCRLLQLPAELRNDIYTYVLSRLSSPNRRLELSYLRFPPLLCTCRQILFEALSIYFASNHFTFTIYFTTQWRLCRTIAPPLNFLIPMLAKYTTVGPILDMDLDVWMPSLYRVSAQGDPNKVHRATLARLRRPETRGPWVTPTMWMDKRLRHELQWFQWQAPDLQDVLTGLVKPVWDRYERTLGSPNGLTRVPFFGWIYRKIFKSLDEQDRTWTRL